MWPPYLNRRQMALLSGPDASQVSGSWGPVRRRSRSNVIPNRQLSVKPSIPSFATPYTRKLHVVQFPTPHSARLGRFPGPTTTRKIWGIGEHLTGGRFCGSLVSVRKETEARLSLRTASINRNWGLFLFSRRLQDPGNSGLRRREFSPSKVKEKAEKER